MALEDIGLLFKIRADADQAKRELRTVSNLVKSETDTMGGGFASAAGKAALFGTAALGAVTGLIAFAKQATSAAADLFDLSQKTGVAVETLSALKNSAETTGGSIGAISSSLGIFQKNMVAAEAGNQKLSATFRQLNIDTEDTEKALRDAFRALAAMPEGANQTASAMQLFGRSGKDVLAIVKESNGDLDGMIERYRELGTLIDTETARQADQFHDSLAQLGQQAGAVARDVASFLIPVLQSLAGVFGIVVDAVKWAGREFENFIGDARAVGNEIARILELAKQVPYVHGGFAAFGGLVNPALGVKPGTAPTFGGSSGRGSGGGGTAEREARERQRREEQAIALLRRQTADAARTTRESLDRDFEQGNKSRESYFSQARADLDKQLRLDLFALKQAQDIAKAYIKNADDLKQKEAEIEQERTELKRRHAAARQKLNDEEREQRIEAELDSLKQQQEVIEFYEKQQLDTAEDYFKRGIVSESALEQLRYEQKDAQLQRRLELIQKEKEAYGELSEKYQQLARDEEFIDAQRIAAKEAYSERLRQILLNQTPVDQVLPNVEGGTENDPYFGLGEPPDFTAHISALEELKNVGTAVFEGMAKGIGNLIQNYILLGNTGPGALKKLLAGVLASVAAEAAVRAIFELAKGFAALFLNPAEAAAHFKAAALFGSIAGVAGVAGRAIAGNSFAGDARNEQGTPTGSRLAASDRAPQPIDVNRRTDGVNINVNVTRDPGSIVEVIVDNYRNNGPVRQVIGGDGQLAVA